MPDEINPYEAPESLVLSDTLDASQFRHLLAKVSFLQRKTISILAGIASAIAVLAWAVMLADHIDQKFQPNMGFWIFPHFGFALLMAFPCARVTYFLAGILRRRIVRPLYTLGFFPCFLLVSPCFRLVDYMIVQQWNFIIKMIVFAGVFTVPAMCAGLMTAGILSAIMLSFTRHESCEPCVADTSPLVLGSELQDAHRDNKQ